ncbi:MAG: ATP-dependent DNA ligase [Acidimicrobiales bacterium]
MPLPVRPPLAPMLCRSAEALPDGPGWAFEPKWDGFRCIVFRDGDDVVLGSRNERPLTRYFPELLEPIRTQFPERIVVDGELVVPVPGGGLDFDALQQRIHPAASRVDRLARETPAVFVAFDLIALGEESLLAIPLAERRRRLDAVLGASVEPIHRSPVTTDHRLALDWFTRFEGAGLDGVIAKPLDSPYTPDKRTLVKVKHRRTADCVVAGYRVHADGRGVGSLLLGLADHTGRLHHVGVASGFTAARRTELRAEMLPLETDALADHPWRDWAEAVAHDTTRLPGGTSRWNAGKDLSWVPVRAERVAEVGFSQLQGRRFRHAAQFLRWRPDRTAQSCRYDQLDVATPVELRSVLETR